MLAACGTADPPAPTADVAASEQRALAEAAEMLGERPDEAPPAARPGIE